MPLKELSKALTSLTPYQFVDIFLNCAHIWERISTFWRKKRFKVVLCRCFERFVNIQAWSQFYSAIQLLFSNSSCCKATWSISILLSPVLFSWRVSSSSSPSPQMHSNIDGDYVNLCKPPLCKVEGAITNTPPKSNTFACLLISYPEHISNHMNVFDTKWG